MPLKFIHVNFISFILCISNRITNSISFNKCTILYIVYFDIFASTRCGVIAFFREFTLMLTKCYIMYIFTNRLHFL